MVPGAKFQPIERAGHYPHIEQPDEFARQALAFAGTGAKVSAKTSAKAG
jgi:pimeloyl-ACP methyl ester carboxylesterase